MFEWVGKLPSFFNLKQEQEIVVRGKPRNTTPPKKDYTILVLLALASIFLLSKFR